MQSCATRAFTAASARATGPRRSRAAQIVCAQQADRPVPLVRTPGGGGGGAVPPAAPLRALVSAQAATCASDNCYYPFGPAMQLEQVQGVLRNALLGAAAAAVVAGGVGPEGSPALPAAWAGIGGGAVTNAKASRGWAGVHAAAAWEAVCGAELSGRAGNGNGAHVPGAVGRQM